MSDKPQTLDLSALEGDYDIIGEIGTRGDARLFMATRRQESSKRRDDDTRVVISVISKPAGDEGNALAHLAADTKQLANLSHRRLIPIIEGRWLGNDCFAVVSQRTSDASIAERISTGEKFSSTRIAAILREVNGVIEWARENMIVHRTVTSTGVFLEPNTDRVRVFFSVEPIHRIRPADASEDGRSIARLAMAMLTGNEDATADDARALAETRDDLPDQLAPAAAALLEVKSSASQQDTAAFLSLIGMADPLAAGESERERIREEILEEQRVEREKLAAERANFEHLMASERGTFEHLIAGERATFAHEMESQRNAFNGERAAFAQEMEAQRNAFAKEMADLRAAFDREMAEERRKHSEHKAELQRAVTAERESLVARRDELEKAVAAQRAEVERIAAADRAQIQKLRLELKRAGELEVEKKRDAALHEITDEESVLDTEVDVPVFIPAVIPPLQELAFNDDSALMRDTAELEATVARKEAVEGGEVAVAEPSKRSRWLIPGSIAAAVVILAVAAVASRQSSSAATSSGEVAKTVSNTPPVPAPAPAPEAAPVVPVIDSAALLQAAADSARVADSVKAAAVRRARRAAARRDSIQKAREDSFYRARDTTAPPDTLAREETLL